MKAIAAGLAKEGFRPVCGIYSTFLQRAFDQIIHDVCLQNLPVVFAIDRAGIVGEDGATHQGIFDLSYLRIIPNLVIMAPKDENELQHMLKTALVLNQPAAVRYPRGLGMGVTLDSEIKTLPVGKGEILCDGEDIVLLAIGNTVHLSLVAASQLKKQKIRAAVVNIRFLKPMDEQLLRKVTQKKRVIVTIEENALAGGLGSAIREVLHDSAVPIYSIGLPDVFIEHGTPDILREAYGLTSEKIVKKIRHILESEKKRTIRHFFGKQ